ncbi:EGF-like domain-containing protein [Heterostelium album PN500]|uniref:EGF-like domain-containing protein n=1 Tax=Heterostelium pallidum (strain ATCC 26659 / Pp 5 / PN500) TaxID=670386 RepID=D3BUZ7_HETP5|nr:EGF-like domain-containing protein [Heterostelium album PN500]EFA74935.1 EGF-like domain-containing protein [Heterostelium album PN500]|eukprot:XP_020427069.1 EGF-like domain-containing protein [Heterostelium album PN500]
MKTKNIIRSLIFKEITNIHQIESVRALNWKELTNSIEQIVCYGYSELVGPITKRIYSLKKDETIYDQFSGKSMVYAAQYCTYVAVKHHRLEVLKKLLKHPTIFPLENRELFRSVQFNCEEIFDYLLANNISCNQACIGDAIVMAATKGYLHLMQKLIKYNKSIHDNYKNDNNNNSSKSTSWQDRILQAFTRKREHKQQKQTETDPQERYPTLYEDNLSKAFRRAVQNGHLHVVVWMQENLNDHLFCGTRVMDLAAEHGYLEILKYLHDNRGEGCSSEALRGAAEHGHLEIIEWIHTNYPYSIDHSIETVSLFMDWECGSVPYSVCQSRINIMSGLGYDQDKNKVMFMGKLDPSGTVVVASVSGSGGGAVTIEYPITTDIIPGSGFSVTTGMQAYVDSTNLVYTIASQRLSQAIGPYFANNNTVNYIWYPRGFQLATYFDESDQRLYTCTFGMWRANYFPTGFIDQSQQFAMLEDSAAYDTRCSFIGRAGSNLYIIQYQYDSPFRSTVSTIDRNCVGCAKATAFTLVASLPFEVTGFAVNNAAMYFGTKAGYYSNETGVFELPLSGDLSKLRKLSSKPVIGLSLNGNSVYFSSTDNSISKIDLSQQSRPVTTLYSNSTSSGSCGCAVGFTGPNCQTCTNGVTRWTNGIPQCVALLPNGQPSSCQQDYECGQVPMAYCNGVCYCRPGFTGSRCETCTGTVTWDYGYPTCNL